MKPEEFKDYLRDQILEIQYMGSRCTFQGSLYEKIGKLVLKELGLEIVTVKKDAGKCGSCHQQTSETVYEIHQTK